MKIDPVTLVAPPQEGDMPRSEKRGIAWTQIGLLEQAGLGTGEKVSDQRAKLVLDSSHPLAGRLTTKPTAEVFGAIRTFAGPS